MSEKQEHRNSMLSLEDEIQRFENESVALLRFSPSLEDRFQRETSASRTRSVLVQGLFSLLAYDCLIVGDYLMDPAHVMRAAMVRFAIFTPLALLVALLLRGRRSSYLREPLTAFLCFFGALTILYLHHNVNAKVSVETQTGLILVLLVTNCLLRLDLPLAAVVSTLIFAADSLALAFDRNIGIAEKLFAGGMLAWAVLLTLIANYAITRERRFSYMLQLRGRLQRGMLSEANAELRALSATDRLTGLPNRRSYDERLLELWKLSVERHAPMSAIMVDVDHFKKLNDAFGHPYGDRVLQRVASLLQQALRGEDDFVARYGGEEFVVLLTDADPDSALKVAERVRTLVQVAGSPALQRDGAAVNDIWATVSCGVATAWPGRADDPTRLIADADAAMYRAKQEGRNRVCAAAAPSAGNLKVFPASANRA